MPFQLLKGYRVVLVRFLFPLWRPSSSGVDACAVTRVISTVAMSQVFWFQAPRLWLYPWCQRLLAIRAWLPVGYVEYASGLWMEVNTKSIWKENWGIVVESAERKNAMGRSGSTIGLRCSIHLSKPTVRSWWGQIGIMATSHWYWLTEEVWCFPICMYTWQVLFLLWPWLTRRIQVFWLDGWFADERMMTWKGMWIGSCRFSTNS
jgi:hypothetical protein